MEKILIIDDDIELCSLLKDFLKTEGYLLDIAHDGRQGVDMTFGETYRLILLDVMLPGLNGFEVLRRIRENSSVPVLMLTARGDDVDRIVGLEMGADDYLPKPFNTRELSARIRAVLRRTHPPSARHSEAALEPLRVGDVEMDPGTRRVTVSGRLAELTAVEFRLLEVLLREAGTVIERERLSELVLRRALSPYDRSLDVHVSSLRKKLWKNASTTLPIQAVRGIGYVYTKPEKSDQ